MSKKSQKTMLAAGAKAPSFRVRDLNGAEQTMEEMITGGPALLVFYKGGCPVCQFTMPYLERIKDNKNVRIIAVSQDDAKATREFLKAFHLTLPTVLDEAARSYPASNGFGISSVPSMFQVEPDGTISHVWAGWSKADMQSLGDRAGMEVLLQGEQVPQMRPG